ncbi:MAG: ribonuclease III [Candidatus Eremiobacteraeota bacterium]|nr:ribonuclease III [Candidatus Eremiobacteraeota bacterium]
MAGESQRGRLRRLLRRAGAREVDPGEVAQALVHASAVRERSDAARLPSGAFASNERLEFLGDTILGYVVGRWLYERYPEADEGELALRKAALVSDAALAPTALRLGFDGLVVLGEGQRRAGGAGRTMLADAFEAFVAALCRAAGFDIAAGFVEREHIVPSERQKKPLGDPKTLLQEWTQKHHRTIPTYADRYEGPPHARTFHARVWVEGEWLAEGSGGSKKEAERGAALRALELLGEHHDDALPRRTLREKKLLRRRTAKPKST